MLHRAPGADAIGGPRRKPLGLLAAINAAGSSGLSRDRAVALLWPDEPIEQGRRALAQTVYALRRETAIPDLVVGDATLTVPAGRLASDHEAFLAALADGELARAVAQYTGPYLDGVVFRGCHEFDRWVDGERARLARAHRDALLTVAEAALRTGDASAATERLERAFAEDPLDASVATVLVRALAAAGDRAAALRAASVHERLLAQDLLARPSAAWEELVRALRNGAPAQTPAAPPPPRAGTGEASARPVGGRDPDAPVQPTTGVLAAPLAPALPAPARNEAVFARPRVPGGRGVRTVVSTLIGVAAALAGAWLVVTGAARRETAPTLPLAPHAVAIAPFAVETSDPTLRYLGNGLPRLVGESLAEGSVDDEGRPVQARRIPAAEDADLGPSASLLAAARAVAATELVTGSVVGRSTRLVARASLVDARTGRVVARAKWEGPADSVGGAAPRLAAQLLLRRRAEPPEHVGALSTLAPTTLRAYLAGHELLRGGQYAEAVDSFATVLRADSTNAFAALGLVAAADWVRDDVPTGRVLARAWAGRAALPPADRAYLDALAGRRFPATTPWVERIADWKRATDLAPERPELWFGLGDALFHVGWLTGAQDALPRARTAFERALERDSLYRPALVHLAQLAAREGDRGALARLARRARAAVPGADSAGESVASFLAWRLAHSGSATDGRGAGTPLHGAGLQWAALAAVHDGLALAEVAARLDTAVRADTLGRDRRDRWAAHAIALARGRPREAARVVLAGAQDPVLRLDALRTLVLDALAGESPDGARYTAELASLLAAAPATTTAALPRDLPPSEREFGECVVALWHARVGDIGEARRRLALLPARPVREDLAPSEVVRALLPCQHLLAATLDATAHPGAHGSAALDSLDRLLNRGDEPGRLWASLPLAVARLHAEAGDSAGALARLRHIPYFWQWPHYRAAELRFEVALARALGDSVGAWCAARHLVSLRDAPETPGEFRMLRAALDTLSASAAVTASRARLTRDTPSHDARACREAVGD